MFSVSNYQISNQIYESKTSLVYRGYRISDRQPVVLKILKDLYPTPERIAWFKREYEVTRNLKLPGVVKAYDLNSDRSHLVMVLEDFGGDSLALLELAGKLTLDDFLELAIAITKILGQIHDFHIVHKDINPSNIVFNPITKQVKIIDFGISTVLSRENTSFRNPNLLEGTLPYISPEQTGRMNRAIDYRTDFYSLGITFYELLTGQLPFEGGDALEWVHGHIAKEPIPLQQLQPNLPFVVGDIVMKSMAKNAEDRYQSAYGLVADLEECWQQIQDSQAIEYFPIGSQDFSDKFTIPQKLYGREAEIAALLAAFDRVSSGNCELLLVAGYSGVGKTALAHEIHKPTTAKKGNFIAGKFELYQRHIPYYAFVQAFNDLCNQLMAESEAKLNEWREKILVALANNGRILLDIIPALEVIIGQQPPVGKVGRKEAQNRLRLVFKSFIKAISCSEKPLAIFIDDLQWADRASLDLLNTILNDEEVRYLLIVGAYRSNEVSSTHPLMLALEDIKNNKISEIHLNNLSLPDINIFIAEALRCPLESSQPLTALIYEKTQGNAFFTAEFISSLVRENLLKFERNLNRWVWDIEAIKAQDITDNVVELMANKIIELDLKTQRVLQLASCIGNRFHLSALAIIDRRSPKDIWVDVFPAMLAGSIVPLDNYYKLIETDEEFIVTEASFKFLHDRVQQAAYSLINENQKQAVHLQIGRLLLANTKEEELSENIFSIVNQFNAGITLIEEETEQIKLAELNLLAAKKAKVATAYSSAFKYLSLGLKVLPSQSWETHYSLTLALYVEAVEAAYLNTDFEEAEKLAAIALRYAKKSLEKIEIYETKIQFYIAQNQMQVAIDTGMQVLKLMKIDLLESPPLIDKIEALYNLPLMQAADKLAVQRILVILHAPAYIANPALLPQLVFTTVNLCINYGNSTLAPFGYAYYGLLLCGVFSDIELGYQFGELAQWLLDRLDAKEIKCKVEVLINACIRHWREPVTKATALLRQAINTGLETGDLEYACTAVATWCANITLVGEPLDSVARQQEPYINFLKNLKQDFYLNYFKIWGQFVVNLRTASGGIKQLIGELFDEAEIIPRFQQTNNFTSLFAAYLAKTILCYLFKDYQQAIANAIIAANYQQSAAGLMIFSQLPFYYSLSLLACYSQVSEERQREFLEKITVNQQQMQNWAKYAPMNFQHKFDLVAAEKSRVLRQKLEAMALYERAIKGAKENNFIHEEALAYELAGEFYLAENLEEIAQTYLAKASYKYFHWGATAKVKDLEERYPQFFSLKLTKNSQINRIVSTSGTDTSTNLDFTSIIKASQVLSSEIVLDKLLNRIVKIAIENAGAEKGFFWLNRGDQWAFVSAKAAANSVEDELTVMPSISGEDRNIDSLPIGIINYVTRTQKSVILSNASLEGAFTQDLYIVRQQPKSILCVPLVNQGKLKGVLYLENNLTVGAFTSDRLEVLRLLSSQASISIENAQLYEQLKDYSHTLEKKVAERTAELEKANQELQRLAQVDGLTQIANRRCFDEHLDREWQRLAREQQPLSIILCDVDYFKLYNDRYGHQQGDACLQQVAKAINNSVNRSADLAARYGGEEFAIILPNTTIEGAVRVAETIRLQVQKLKMPHAASTVSKYVSLSLGVASIVPNQTISPEELIAAADRSLYEAKKRGRNRLYAEV
jgi:diguanylate cyclase (GGDEF)-like protein